MTGEVRNGWELMWQGSGMEKWFKVFSGALTGTVVCWADGEVTFCVEDNAGATIAGGKGSSRGWAMNTCELESRRRSLH